MKPVKRRNRGLVNWQLFFKNSKRGGLQLIVDNDYPITCFTFNPFWKMYGIFFAIEGYLQFSLTYDSCDYGEELYLTIIKEGE